MHTAPNTPGTRKAQWALPILEKIGQNPPLTYPLPWMEEDEDSLKQLNALRAL